MIVEVAALALVVAATVAVGRVRAVRRRRRARPPSRGESSPRALAVGDVLLHGREELWLAGSLVLREVAPVLTLFRTPGSASEWLVSLDPAGASLALLSSSDRVGPGAVPSELRWEGHRLVLGRRGHARVEATGEMLPPCGPLATYALLESVGGRVALVVEPSEGPRLALLGRRVDPEGLEHLGGPGRAGAQVG